MQFGADLPLADVEPLLDVIAAAIAAELIDAEKKRRISKREHESSDRSENQSLRRRDHRSAQA